MALFANEQQVESMLKDGNALQSAATIDTELTNQFALALMQSWANTDDNYEGTERILGISREADGGITVNFGGTERKIIFPVGGEGGEHFVTLTEDGQLTLTPLYEVEGEPNFKIITSNARTFHPDGS